MAYGEGGVFFCPADLGRVAGAGGCGGLGAKTLMFQVSTA